jgi:arylsulfatase A-like enzyme
MDLVPTFLELAGVSHPETKNGQEVPQIQGKSWISMLGGEEESPRAPDDWLGWEFFGERAIRMGDWKITMMGQPFGVQNRQEVTDWKLYNVVRDPAERHDLSDQYPEKTQELIACWDEYVKQNNIIVSEWNTMEIMSRKALPDPYPEHDNFPPAYGAEEMIRQAMEKRGKELMRKATEIQGGDK